MTSREIGMARARAREGWLLADVLERVGASGRDLREAAPEVYRRALTNTRSGAALSTWGRPAYRRRLVASLRRAWADPRAKARRAAAIRAGWTDEKRARRAAAMRRMWRKGVYDR